MRSYSWAAEVTVLHLTGTLCVRDCPAAPNIAHPELAYTEKPKGKQHKEETADRFLVTKALCVHFMFACELNPTHNDVIFITQYVPTYFNLR